MCIINYYCDICGSNEIEQVEKINLKHCIKCGHYFVDEFPPEKEIIGEYSRPVYYKESSEVEELAVRNLWERRYRGLRKYFINKNASFLDVGCGRGFMLELARKDGLDVVGTEYCSQTAAYAKNIFKLNVLITDLLDINLAENKFDIISMWHVLEHIKYPSKYLEKIAKLIKKEGIFVVEVPNIEEKNRSLKYHVAQNRTHYHFFSEKTLTALLLKQGFTIKKISYENADCYKDKITSKIHHELKTILIKFNRWATGRNTGATIRLLARKS